MKKVFYFILTVLLAAQYANAQVTVPGTPVTPQVSTADNPKWYLMMVTTTEEPNPENRYRRFLQWNGTKLRTEQFVNGMPATQITDNYKWCLEDAGDGNVYLRNAANNQRITVPTSITGNNGNNTPLVMSEEGSKFRWGLSKDESNAPSTCAEKQYIFANTGVTENNAYINAMGAGTNDFGISIWSGGINGASGWFFYEPYPAMTRKYDYPTTTQQNRYLDKVTYTVQGEEHVVFEAKSESELPYTEMPTPANKATSVGALIDKTSNKIVLPAGTTAFDMNFRQWKEIISGNNPEIKYATQAYYIDFNQDFKFEGKTDEVDEISNGEWGGQGFDNENGWTRTISLPANLKSGTYRMRVIYHQPNNEPNWTTDMFTKENSGEIRNGIAYDFDIVIEESVENLYAKTISPSELNATSGLTRIEVSDHILGEYNTSLDNRGNELTLCAWINLQNDSKDSNRYGKGNAIMSHSLSNCVGAGNNPSFSIYLESANKMNIYSRTRTDISTYPEESTITGTSTDIPEGWFHLALTAKVENGNLEYNVYINGKKSETLSKTTTSGYNVLPYLTEDCQFAFGGDMNCKFDDIMIWNKAIDNATVKDAMKGFTDAELLSKEGLLAYYTFDDLKGTNNESANLIVAKSDYKAKLLTLTGTINNNFITAEKKEAPSEITNYVQKSERDVPRGGEKFFENDADATWLTNGDESFGYIIKSDKIKRLAYDGIRKVALADDVLAVYHNGDAELPTYVKATDLESMTGAKTEMPSSYVVAGLDYTVQMPNVEKQWMPISMPAEVDLVTIKGGNGVRPGKNFWYAEPVVTGKNVTWTDITDEGNADGSSYTINLNPGIISIPQSRINEHFVFFTAMNTPVVMRAYNQAYAAAQMPQAGVLKFVANPYATTVTAAQLTGNATNMTIYRMNAASGNFDPVEGTVKLKEFEPVFVFNNGGNPSNAPRYIGTKDVSGVLEAEAVYNVNVRGTEGAVEVEAFVPADVEIFTVNGVMVAAENIEGTHTFALESGIYVVRTVAEGNISVIKVIVE